MITAKRSEANKHRTKKQESQAPQTKKQLRQRSTKELRSEAKQRKNLEAKHRRQTLIRSCEAYSFFLNLSRSTKRSEAKERSTNKNKEPPNLSRLGGCYVVKLLASIAF